MAVGGLFELSFFVKAEIISWFRIQETSSAFSPSICMGCHWQHHCCRSCLSNFLLKFNIKTIHGETIEFHKKEFNRGQIFGILLPGLGHNSACPGPLFTVR